MQTGELESVHSLYMKYVPKREKFASEGMQARLQVAALDHNCSVNRQQARTKTGQLRYKLEYSKPAGSYVAKPIKEQKDHSFKTEVVEGIKHRCSEGITL